MGRAVSLLWAHGKRLNASEGVVLGRLPRPKGRERFNPIETQSESAQGLPIQLPSFPLQVLRVRGCPEVVSFPLSFPDRTRQGVDRRGGSAQYFEDSPHISHEVVPHARCVADRTSGLIPFVVCATGLAQGVRPEVQFVTSTPAC